MVLLFYGWQVLGGTTILGVAHTAPFSPWSFGDYLSRMTPLLWVGVLFFLTFFTSPKARRVASLTDAAPMPPHRYALARCAAALAEIDELLDRNLADNAAKMGAYFMEKLKTLPHVKEVRGQGLLIGVEFDDTVNSVDVKHECLHRHLLLTAIGDHIIRMVPPLIIDEKDCDEAYEIIKASVEALS